MSFIRQLTCIHTFLLILAGMTGTKAQADETFHQKVLPILERNCFGCHADGSAEGNLSFDNRDQAVMLDDKAMWWSILKNVRAGLMPPASEPKLSNEDREVVLDWIKSSIFKSDLSNADPGRVTVRRLNRMEYRNTIRDLMGIDFNAEVVFPPDDTGFGFDNNGDVLSLSPIMLEKYLASARSIVQEAVPTVNRVTPTTASTVATSRSKTVE